MSEEELRLTAYHEAGHAIVAWVVGLEMEGVSIEPQESSLGRVTFVPVEDIAAYNEILHRRLVSTYAGVRAVELFTSRPTDPGNPNLDPRDQGSDWDEITDLTFRLAGPEESAQVAVQERASEEAQQILRENWYGVESVAEALLRHRSLQSANLSRILEEANCPRGEPVYEYELDQVGDRLWTLRLQYNELVRQGCQEKARRVAEENARLEAWMEDVVRSAER